MHLTEAFFDVLEDALVLVHFNQGRQQDRFNLLLNTMEHLTLCIVDGVLMCTAICTTHCQRQFIANGGWGEEGRPRWYSFTFLLIALKTQPCGSCLATDQQ